MRYLLIILIFVSCNSGKEKMSVDAEGTYVDSLKISQDSTIQKLADLDTLTSEIYRQTYLQIKELRQEKKELIKELEQKYPTYQAIKPNDEQLRRINELNNRLSLAEFDLARLRRDSAYRANRTVIGQKLNKIIEEPVKPNENSLMVGIIGKIDRGVSVYIIPYSKKAKRAVMNYDSCNDFKLDELGARQAFYYDGQYFFNDVLKGRYIIKLCAFYGSYTVIDRDKEIRQTVAIPIQ